MEVLTRTNGREMTLAISGELDHHGAHGAMQQIDHALDAALPLSLTMEQFRECPSWIPPGSPWCCAHTAAWRRSAEV